MITTGRAFIGFGSPVALHLQTAARCKVTHRLPFPLVISGSGVSMDKFAKRFLTKVHTIAEPTHRPIGAY